MESFDPWESNPPMPAAVAFTRTQLVLVLWVLDAHPPPVLLGEFV